MANPWDFNLQNMMLSGGDPSAVPAYLAPNPGVPGTALPPGGPQLKKMLKPKLTKQVIPKIDRMATTEKQVDLNKQMDITNQDTKDLSKGNTYIQPDELQSLADSIRGLPEFGEAKEGQQGLVDALDMLKGMDTKETPWLKPLLALTDSQTGSNLMAGYEQGFTEKDKAALVLKYADELSKRKSDAAKNLMSGIGKMKSGEQLMQILQGQKAINTNMQTDTTSNMQGTGFVKPVTKGKGAGLKRLSEKTVMALGDASSINTLLDDLGTTFSSNKGAVGPVVGRINALNPWDEVEQTINTQAQSIRQTLGKLKEGGVLRLEDEKKYDKMLPGIKDTPEVAANKIKIMKRELGEKIQNHIKGLSGSGYDTKGVNVFGEEVGTTQLPKSLSGKKPARKKPLSEMSQAELDAYEKSLRGK